VCHADKSVEAGEVLIVGNRIAAVSPMTATGGKKGFKM
jgi:hypothetical protein